MAATGNGMTADGEPMVTVHSTGYYLVGGLMGYKDAKPREVNNRTYRNTDIGLLVGGEIVSVQAEDHAAAVAATGGASQGDVIAVRVESKSGVKDGRPWQFFTTFRGGSLDASDYGF
jgi:hypothetical protein